MSMKKKLTHIESYDLYRFQIAKEVSFKNYNFFQIVDWSYPIELRCDLCIVIPLNMAM
jgi:hypothetical protein